jgi:hypothetical protein
MINQTFHVSVHQSEYWLLVIYVPSSFQFKSHILIYFINTLIYSYILQQNSVCNQYAIKATSWEQHK